jgi:hypothetical protein
VEAREDQQDHVEAPRQQEERVTEEKLELVEEKTNKE